MFKSITSFSFIIVVGIFLISCDSEINSSQNTTDSDAINIQSGKKQTVGSGAKSIGKVTVGTDASVWDSDIPRDDTEGIYPIGGSGQINGEFAIAERKGIQIGMRIQERREGTYEASGKRVGVYESETGFSSGTRAVWNYDWHVDLRDAKGKLADKTLGDYDLTLETDIAESLFGFPEPVDLTFGGGFGPDNALLFQSSFNPDFGNNTFDATVEATYNFRLVLTPKTFSGGPLAVKVQVVVSN